MLRLPAVGEVVDLDLLAVVREHDLAVREVFEVEGLSVDVPRLLHNGLVLSVVPRAVIPRASRSHNRNSARAHLFLKEKKRSYMYLRYAVLSSNTVPSGAVNFILFPAACSVSNFCASPVLRKCTVNDYFAATKDTFLHRWRARYLCNVSLLLQGLLTENLRGILRFSRLEIAGIGSTCSCA